MAFISSSIPYDPRMRIVRTIVSKQKGRFSFLTAVIFCRLIAGGCQTALADENTKYQTAFAAVKAMTGDDLTTKSLEPARKAYIAAMTRANNNSPEKAAEMFDKLLPKMRAMFAGLIQARARIFAGYFSTDELTDIIAFYSTPTGRKLAGSQTVINLEVGPELGPMMRDLLVIGAGTDAARQPQSKVPGQAQ